MAKACPWHAMKAGFWFWAKWQLWHYMVTNSTPQLLLLLCVKPACQMTVDSTHYQRLGYLSAMIGKVTDKALDRPSRVCMCIKVRSHCWGRMVVGLSLPITEIDVDQLQWTSEAWLHDCQSWPQSQADYMTAYWRSQKLIISRTGEACIGLGVMCNNCK